MSDLITITAPTKYEARLLQELAEVGCIATWDSNQPVREAKPTWDASGRGWKTYELDGPPTVIVGLVDEPEASA